MLVGFLQRPDALKWRNDGLYRETADNWARLRFGIQIYLVRFV